MKFRNILVFIFILFCLITASYAINSKTTGYKLSAGSRIKIYIPEYPFNKIYKNNCGKSYFIPTKTKAQADSFQAHKPSCIQEMSCNIDTLSIPAGGSACCPSSRPYKGGAIINKPSFIADLTCCNLPPSCSDYGTGSIPNSQFCCPAAKPYLAGIKNKGTASATVVCCTIY